MTLKHSNQPGVQAEVDEGTPGQCDTAPKRLTSRGPSWEERVKEKQSNYTGTSLVFNPGLRKS